MRNLFLLLLISVISVAGPVAGAQNSGFSRPLILSGNPLYFFKEFGRNVQRLFAFGATADALLELKILEKKAAEIKALAGKKKAKIEDLEEAVQNYKRSAERLSQKMQSFRSGNPEVEGFLDGLALGVVKHGGLFEEIISQKEELKESLEEARGSLHKSFRTATEGASNAAAMAKRLENALKNLEDDALKEFKAVNVLSRLEEGLPVEAAGKISALKDDLIVKFEARFSAEKEGLSQALQDFFTVTPERLRIFDEVREKISESGLKSVLNVIRQNALRTSGEEQVVGEVEAAEAIAEAEREKKELQQKLDSGNGTSNPVRQLLEKADFHLEQAKNLYESGEYPGAFGQATASQAESKNALSQLEPASDDVERVNLDLRVEFDELVKNARGRGLNEENAAGLYVLFGKAEKIILEAKTAPALKEAKSIIAEIDVLITRLNGRN